MAEFGIQATELSAPQGAGSNPISPVTTSLLDNGVADSIGNIASIFQKGLENDAKAKEKAFAEGILKGYASEQGAISEAVASGGLSPAAAASRSRSLFNKYLASYPQFQKDLSGVQGAFQAGTETGSAFDQVKDEATQRKDLIGKMQGKGFPVTLDQPKSVQDSWIATFQQEERMQERFMREEQRKEAMRAEGKWNESVENAVAKKRAERDLSELGFQHLDSIFTTATDYSNKVRTGALDSTQAKLNIESQFSKVLQSINLMGAANPELATSYRGMFERAREAAIASLDPNITANESKARADILLNEARLRLVSDPKTANRIALSQAFGNAPELASRILGAPTDALTRIDNMLQAPGTSAVAPVTGTESDKVVLDTIENGIKAYQTGKAKDSDAAKEENANMVRNYLNQYGKQSNLAPAQLKDSTKFFASASFGRFAEEVGLNSSELKPARDAFQMQYEGPVVKAVNEALNKVVPVGIAPMRAVTGAKVGEEKPLAIDRIQVNFDGTNISFGMKGKVDSGMGAEVSSSTRTLNEAAQALNEVIKVGAHMSGTTNYSKYFEEEKHVLLPQFFSGYEGLEIGQVVNGKRYVGGDAKSPSSWKDAGGK